MTTTQTETPTLAQIKADPTLAPTALNVDSAQLTNDLRLYQVGDNPRRHSGTSQTSAGVPPVGLIFWWDGETVDSDGDIQLMLPGARIRWVHPTYVERIPTYHENTFPDGARESGLEICTTHSRHCLDPVGTVDQDCVDCQRLLTPTPTPAPTQTEPTPGFKYGRDNMTGTPLPYRVMEGARAIESGQSYVPPAGTVILWDGVARDDDGEVTIVQEHGDGFPIRHYYVDPQYLELANPQLTASAGTHTGAEIEDHERVGLTVAAGQASYLEGLVAQLTEERDQAQRRIRTLEARFEQLSQALLDEADTRGWCSEYEEFVDNHPNMGLRKRTREFTVTMLVQVEVETTVTAKDEREARHFARNGDLGSLVYNLERDEIDPEIREITSVEPEDPGDAF